MKTLVIASNRLEAISSWRNHWYNSGFDDWDRCVLVIDADWLIPQIDSREYIYNWSDIPEGFPKKTSAIKSFGFFKARHSDYIGCLDDDCLPVEPFFGGHIKNMRFPLWEPTCNDIVPRGMPINTTYKSAVLNIGLWSGVADTYATTLIKDYIPNSEQKVYRNGLVPLCGMNFCFKKEILPALPFFGGFNLPTRFDDIWAGIICKNVCDHLKMSWTSGSPIVKHLGLSDRSKNHTLELNDFDRHRVISGEYLYFNENSVKGCVIEFADGLYRRQPQLSKLSQYIKWWCSIL